MHEYAYAVRMYVDTSSDPNPVSLCTVVSISANEFSSL